MASIESRHNTKGKTYRIRLSETEHPNRPRIGLGKCTKRQANTAMLNIENLLCAKRTGDPVSPSTQNWLVELPISTRNRLVSLGLARPRQHNDIAIGEWIDNYIESRTDIKAGTATAMKQAAKDIEGYFDKDTLISNFTEHDASSLRIKLLDRGLAESTVRRRCKYARQFFEAAVKKRIIDENPFNDVPVAGRINTDRQQFISQDDIQKVIEACPNAQWRLIFALSRYGGLRIPSELFGLTWDDILWDKKRFIIHSPKTEHIEGKANRVCPLFVELEPYLMDVFEQSKTGQKKVITIYNKTNPNLRTQATKIIKRAGLKTWPKLFQNLRASRETELVEKFPIHVVTGWLGNSPDIAHKHYLQTHEEHFKRAVGNAAEKSGTDRGLNHAESGCTHSQGKHRGGDVSLLNAVVCERIKKGAPLCETHLIVPRGFEPLLPG